ncbi:alpha/beta fold hydrolase [Nocardia miyunensis]|uniref:alpha/beta fold hydrolase n=1 Tax=Nocardia miyunensis TaxID=282684 RepID=UPI0008297FC8|nr:alpha/beta fold hydrolase [Nocardia miyunensis]
MTYRALRADSPWTAVDWTSFTREVQFRGRRLRYVDVGSGTPILLVHGLGGSWQTWLENLPALSSRYRVIAVDLPGFGQSQPLPQPVTIDDLVGSLTALLDELDIGQAVVIGHSLGGLVSMRLADAHPDRVRRLILLSSGGAPLGEARLAAINLGFTAFNALFALPGVPGLIARRRMLRRTLLRGFTSDPDSLAPQLAAEVIPAMRAPGFKAAISAGVRANRVMNPARITCPVLVIWGENDRILPLAAATELVDNLADARLEVIEGVGHCAMFESPAVFNAIVLHYLEEAHTRPWVS